MNITVYYYSIDEHTKPFYVTISEACACAFTLLSVTSDNTGIGTDFLSVSPSKAVEVRCDTNDRSA